MDSCKSVTITSDEEGCMPKIINTVSLQGTELQFNDEPENEEDQNLLFPVCEIKEITTNEGIKTEPVENGLSPCPNVNEKKKEKKRLTLTQLPPVKREKSSHIRPSTSRRDDVVDAKGLALQESLFKTKELFDTFLRVCQDHENSEQMERVVQKMTRAYRTAKQEFLGSLFFQNILETETEKVNTSNTKPWLNLMLVISELKHNKKGGSSKLKIGESEESQDAGGSNDDEPVIECPKKRRHLKKLEKVLRAINLKIKKIEEREVDWDDEDNSAYLKLDRYREQFTKIYAKICEIKGKLPDADRPYLRKVSFAGTTYPHINRCIEKFYNKHREFPDFQDIKKLVTLALKQEGIEMQPIKIHSMAQAAFKEFGEMLKRLRQYDDYDVLVSYLDQQVDPARDNEELQERLNQNALLFKKKEQEVIDKFAERESAKDLGSDSGEDSDEKPKKKRMKLIKSSDPKRKPSSPTKHHGSSSESADEEKEQSKPITGLSSDDETDSEETFKRIFKCKGKSLIGKQRIVKKGVAKNSPNKSKKPKTSISSDEESAPGNTKESLTSYLGLTGSSSLSAKKESKNVSVSEDETQRLAGGSHNPMRNASSDNSNNDHQSRSVVAQSKRNGITISNDFSKSDMNINTIADSDSDVEPIAVVTKSPPKSEAARKHKPNQARKSTGPRNRSVPMKHVPETKINTHETISDSGSESRTSVESEKKKLSDVELSPDSSDGGEKMRREAKADDDDDDDTIVILSEDVLEEPKPQQDSSDSDDICILSQIEVERRTVAPRKMKPNSVTASGTQLRRPSQATSTPNKNSKPIMKRRLSNQSNDDRSTKTRKLNLSSNFNGKQTQLPQMINGASRKVLISRVTKSGSSSGKSTPDSIPLIELD
ncbi:death domain-associated protein 6-like [Macrosteles quadrilineatus]|uniref:death domain-associated protein 6-like n=1 Tax=Macrosteles quadrilineatus TaxID=74068 RepID=UPI0023E34350|nr:death domain-associated protein 6-like [Macrosteles quadrilineatus]